MKTNGKTGTWMNHAVKAIFCLTLSLVLALGLLPGMTRTAEAHPSYLLWVGDTEIESATASGEGWSYSHSDKTLILNNANISGGHKSDSESGGIYYKGSDTLTIILAGNNTILNTFDSGVAGGIYASSASIVIQGDGSLTCTGGTGSKSYGIYAKNLTVKSGTVTFNGGTASGTDAESCGVYSRGNLTIQGGTLTGNGGKSSDGSRGIAAYNNTLTISGGTVTGNGGKAKYSGGISAMHITMTAGNVSAKGGAAEEQSFGFSGWDMTVSGGTVTAAGGNATDSWGVAGEPFELTINSGVTSFTATGNSAAMYNVPLKNAVVGAGWTDTDGTAGRATIEISSDYHDWQYVSDYKKIQLPVTYDLWVSGTQVTGKQKSGTGWSYDSDSNTLTLNNYTYTGAGFDPDGTLHQAAVFNKISDLKIVLAGSSSITNTNNGTGIYSHTTSKGITISGSGSLNVKARSGIYSWGGITIDGGTFKIDAIDSGLDSTGHIYINGGNVEATATGGTYRPEGISSSGGVYITGGTITAKGDYSGIYAEMGNPGILISGGTVSAEGTGLNGIGLYAAKKGIRITGGKVTATGELRAMWPAPTDSIAGTAWTDMEGTTGQTEIAANASGVNVDDFMKVQFPAAATTYTVTVGYASGSMYGGNITYSYTGHENQPVFPQETLTVPGGDTLTLKATPDSGYTFVGWFRGATTTIFGPAVSTSTEWKITVTEEEDGMKYCAVFAAQDKVLTEAAATIAPLRVGDTALPAVTPPDGANYTVTPAVTGKIHQAGTDTEVAFADIVAGRQYDFFASFVANTDESGRYVWAQGTDGVSINPEGGQIYEPYFLNERVLSVRIRVTAAAPTYTVETVVLGDGHGTVSVDKTSAAAGETVTITATPDAKYELSRLTVWDADKNDVTVTDYTFIMPESNAMVRVAFVRSQRRVYVSATAGGAYSFDGASEQYTASNGTVSKIVDTGSNVVLAAVADSGYTFKGWYEGVLNSSGYMTGNNGTLVSPAPATP